MSSMNTYLLLLALLAGLAVDCKPIRSVAPLTVKLWPNAIIPFTIDPVLLKPEYQANIRKAINEYQQKTCLHFIRRTKETAYLRFFDNQTCYSDYIGYSGGKQNISLGPGCLSTGIIIHEIGHAIAFGHEHSRLDRDQFITVDMANISSTYRDQFSTNPGKHLSPYDYYSIMHYGEWAFSVKNGGATMVPKKKNVTLMDPAERGRLSPLDVEAINTLYSCQDHKKKKRKR